MSRKRIVLVFAIFLSAAGAIFAVIGGDRMDGATEDELIAQLWSSTNYWMISAGDFERTVYSGPCRLRVGDSARARDAFRGWSEFLLSAPLPEMTNDVSVWGCWSTIKAEMLRRGIERCSDAGCTNVWLGAADFFGESRGLIRNWSSKEWVSERRAYRKAHPELSFGELKAMGLRMQSVSSEGFQICTTLREPICESIGKKYIPALPVEMRWNFYSNFVERARLTEVERAEIRAAITAKECK